MTPSVNRPPLRGYFRLRNFFIEDGAFKLTVAKTRVQGGGEAVLERSVRFCPFGGKPVSAPVCMAAYILPSQSGRDLSPTLGRQCRVLSIEDNKADLAILTRMTQLYGPAVRCKWFRRAGGERSCINVSGL